MGVCFQETSGSCIQELEHSVATSITGYISSVDLEKISFHSCTRFLNDLNMSNVMFIHFLMIDLSPLNTVCHTELRNLPLSNDTQKQEKLVICSMGE